jgi:hypothetical protein
MAKLKENMLPMALLRTPSILSNKAFLYWVHAAEKKEFNAICKTAKSIKKLFPCHQHPMFSKIYLL